MTRSIRLPSNAFFMLIIVILSVIFMLLFSSQKSQAQILNRSENYGYFYDRGDNNGGSVIDFGFTAMNITDFFNQMDWAINMVGRNDTGAAFIVLSMLGYPAGTSKTLADSTTDAAYIRWKSVVTSYNNQNRINWNFNYTYTTNTFYQGEGCCTINPDDVAWYSSTSTQPSIVFINQGGSNYAIKKSCGNPVGQMAAIDTPPLIEIYPECYYKRVAIQANDVEAGNLGMGYKIYSAGTAAPTNWTTSDPATINVGSGVNATWYIDMSTRDQAVSWTIEAFTTGVDPKGDTGQFSNIVLPAAKTYACPDRVGAIAIYPECYYKRVAIQANDPNAGNLGMLYKIWQNGTTEPPSSPGTNSAWTMSDPATINVGSGVNATWYIDMSTWDQAVSWNIKAKTTGVDPTGGVGILITATNTYDCPPPPPPALVNKPYVRVYGGDIFAGINSGGSSDCPGWGSNKNSGIYGFTDQTVADTATKGSGGQLGVLALGPIKAFSSAVLRTIEPMPPYGLTASNDTATYGNLGVKHCPHDYWADKPNIVSIVEIAAYTGISFYTPLTAEFPQTAGTHYMYYNGNVNFSNNFNSTDIYTDIPIGQKLYIYVDGDVKISSDIIYTAGVAGNWSTGDTTKIPHFQLVATGNIYIYGTGSLTRLDGVYVAQGKTVSGVTTGGTIDTCGSSISSSIFSDATAFIRGCSSPLTVYGSLVARKIKWDRTYGTMSASQANEHPSTASHACYDATSPLNYLVNAVPAGVTPAAANQSVCAAEIINHSPETWLVTPSASTSTSRYNYVQAHPPLL